MDRYHVAGKSISRTLTTDCLSDLHADSEVEQAVEKVELSSREIAFAFLLEGQAVASHTPNVLVIGAVKAKHANTWKDVVCSCFSLSVKQHLEHSLESSDSLKDVFVVFKLIRCHFIDVTEYVVAELTDVNDREPFSLQVRGMEAVRHMTFHGEFVSLPEVYTSVRLLISILTSLRCGQRQIAELKGLAERIVETFQTESKSYHMLSIAMLVKAKLF